MAWLRELFGPRLKEMVTTGNWPWCAMVRGLDVLSICVKAESGIGADVDVVFERSLPPEAGGLYSAMLVKLLADKSAGVWVERERLDCCAGTPLIADTANVETEVIALLKEVRPDAGGLEMATL
jgi:hypothetical protein